MMKRWVRRHPLGSFIAFLITLTLAVRLIVGAYTHRRLSREVAGLRSHGEPISFADVSSKTISDAENAYLAFEKAASAITADSPRTSSLEYPTYPPFGDAWTKLAKRSESRNADVFVLARQARSLTELQTRMQLNASRSWSPNHLRLRLLANTLADGAIYAHLAGRDGEAIDRILDALGLARAMRRDRTLLSQHVGMEIDSLALNVAQQAAPALAVSGTPAGPHASRAQVQELIRVLLDERELRDSTAQAFRCERALMLDGFAEQSKYVWALRPVVDHAAFAGLSGWSSAITASEQEYYPAARAALIGHDDYRPRSGNASKWRLAGSFRFSGWFEDYRASTVERYIDVMFRDLSERRTTATILAAQLYRHDRHRWPRTLNELVPAYLPAVLRDPNVADGKALGYMVLREQTPSGVERPLVFFEYGFSDGSLIDAEPMFGWQPDRRENRPRPEPIRQYRDLTIWLPTTRRFDEEEQPRLLEEAFSQKEEQPHTPGDEVKDERPANGPP